MLVGLLVGQLVEFETGSHYADLAGFKLQESTCLWFPGKMCHF